VTGDARPLAGVSVVLTRPAPAGAGAPADRLAGALRAAGARVLSVPAVAIVDPEDGGAALRDVARRVGEYRWVVLTSQHAVERLFRCLGDARPLRGVRLAAVGAATAAALAAHHARADLVPGAARQSSEGLVAAFPEAPASGGRVLFPRSAIARPTLAAGLRAKGWAVDEVVVYSTVPATAPTDDVAAAVGRASAVTFSSPSALDGYLAMRTAAGRPLPIPSVVVCVGGVTARAAREAGLRIGLEAPVGDPAAVVAGLAGVLGGAVAGRPPPASSGAGAGPGEPGAP
jgi:uroporphyrinogen-III synthase